MSRTPKRLGKNSHLTKILGKYLKSKSSSGKDEAEIVIVHFLKARICSSFINPLYLQQAKHDQSYREDFLEWSLAAAS